MKLTNYNPRNLSLWNDFFDDYLPESFFGKGEAWVPSAKVVDKGNTYHIEAELPGVSKDDIKVEVDNGVLTLSGSKKSEKHEDKETVHYNEIHYGSFSRSFRLGEDVDGSKITAAYNNGVLRIEIPKTEKSVAKNIEVK